MRPTAALAWLLLAAPFACGANPLTDVTTSWEEEVRLRTGETVVLDRSLTRGLGGRYQRGGGPAIHQSIAFWWKGRRIRWETKEQGIVEHLPLVLDIVDGAPFIATPVLGPQACQKYGTPAESWAGWREERGTWTRVGRGSLPADPRINLWQVPDRPEGVVTLRWKEENGAKSGRPHGKPLAEYALSFVDACVRGTPDAGIEAKMQPVLQAEARAATVVAQRVAFADAPEPFSGADLLAGIGKWVEAADAWISTGCRYKVKSAKRRFRYLVDPVDTPNVHTGYVVEILAGPADNRVALGPKPALRNIACDGDQAIAVVRGDAADRVLVDRFDAMGRIVSATWVQLPGAAELSATRAMPEIVGISFKGPRLGFVLADYAHDGSPAKGGTLRRKAAYEVDLAAR